MVLCVHKDTLMQTWGRRQITVDKTAPSGQRWEQNLKGLGLLLEVTNGS